MAADDLIDLYLTHLAERGCTEATLDTNRAILHRADVNLPFGLDRSDDDELRAYLYRRDKPLAWSSQRTYYVTLNCFYQWAKTSRILRSNPMEHIATPKTRGHLPRVAEDHHVQWVLSQAAQPYRLWGTLAAYGNLRCIEIARLHREHITEHDIVIHRGKGDKARLVPTHALVWDAVRNLPHGPVTDCTPNQVSIRFWKYCVRSGIRGLSMHRLRGWWATAAYNATHDVLTVQLSMGHESASTTAGYIRRTRSQARAVVDALPTFGPSAATA